MPFTGAIKAAMRPHVAEVADGWPDGDIYVGSSGNFSIERSIAAVHPGRFRFVSNDVSLYSCATGYACDTRLPPGLHIRDSYLDQYEWLGEWISEPDDLVATLLLSTKMLEGVHRHSKWHTRMRKAYRDQWDDVHRRTRARVEKALAPLRGQVEMAACDVVEHAAGAPDGRPFAAFPPTYSGGYERLYRGIDEVFGWDEPSYPWFDDDAWHRLLDLVTPRPWWLLGRDVDEQRLEDGGWLRGRFQTSARAKPIRVWASHGPTRLVETAAQVESLLVPRLTGRDQLDVDASLQVLKVTSAQMMGLKQQYVRLKDGTAPSQLIDGIELAVLVNGRLAGGFTAIRPQMGVRSIADAYILTDFAIWPSDVPRLSKLVLAAILAKPTVRMIQAALWCTVERVMTTAFTDKPVSMKYRGLFDLHSRPKDPPRLQYVAEAPRFDSLQDAYSWWWGKHGRA